MEEDDIAAAMGFSSFGGVKRKHDETHSPKTKPAGSGANSTELGVRTKGTTQEGGDKNEHSATNETTKGKQKRKAPTSSGLADFLTRGHSLPEKPTTAKVPNPVPLNQDDSSEMVSFGGPEISKASLSELRRGVANEEGDMAYFLPSFVENPWERIGKTQQRQ